MSKIQYIEIEYIIHIININREQLKFNILTEKKIVNTLNPCIQLSRS